MHTNVHTKFNVGAGANCEQVLLFNHCHFMTSMNVVRHNTSQSHDVYERPFSAKGLIHLECNPFRTQCGGKIFFGSNALQYLHIPGTSCVSYSGR